MFFNQVLKQAVIIVSNRLLLLLMPLVDLLILDNTSAKETAYFSLSAQYVQIAVILVVTSVIGVNIVIKQDQNILKQTQCCVGYVLCVALFSSVVLYTASYFWFSPKVHLINGILFFGIPFCCVNLKQS